MITINQINTDSATDIISSICDLSLESCNALAEFIDECFCDGIDFDRLKLIAEEAREYDDAEELANDYLNDDQIDELKEEAREDGDEDDWVDLAIEKIQDDYAAIILRHSAGLVIIE